METDSTTQVSKSRRGQGGGAPQDNKNALKHGLHTYKTMLNGNGLDERTSLFKALREKEQELVKALGSDPSPQEQAIIGDSVKNMLYIASLDNYLMGLKSLVRKGRPHPAIKWIRSDRRGPFSFRFICQALNLDPQAVRAAINEAWEHGGADFQSRFDKSTAQAEQMKEGALRVL
jgi:hypothetical protein